MPSPRSLTEICTVFAARRTLIAIELGSKVNLAALAIRCDERLREPAAVAAHEEALVGHVDGEAVAAAVELVVALRHRRLDDAFDRDLLAHQRDLALRGPRDVDQLLDQVAEPADLALEDLAQANQDRVACSRACAGRWPRWRSAPAGCAARARAWPGTGPDGARPGAAAGCARRAIPRAPCARGCRRSCRRSRSVRRRCRSGARRCRASSGIRRRGGAGASPSRTARAASKLVARMPRQRSRSSGWTARVQPSPCSSSAGRPV